MMTGRRWQTLPPAEIHHQVRLLLPQQRSIASADLHTEVEEGLRILATSAFPQR